MQIDIKGRNVPVTDEIRTHTERRLNKVARQVSDLARLEIEIFKEPNPRVADCQVAEATLYLKGVTLRARDASPEMLHSLNPGLSDVSARACWLSSEPTSQLWTREGSIGRDQAYVRYTDTS